MAHILGFWEVTRSKDLLLTSLLAVSVAVSVLPFLPATATRPFLPLINAFSRAKQASFDTNCFESAMVSVGAFSDASLSLLLLWACPTTLLKSQPKEFSVYSIHGSPIVFMLQFEELETQTKLFIQKFMLL